MLNFHICTCIRSFLYWTVFAIKKIGCKTKDRIWIVAKTDLGAMFGIVDCIRECKKHWNKTDMGCEIYMPKDT